MIVRNGKPVNQHFIPLNSIDQLDEVDAQSNKEVVYLIKHSTRCGISHAALEEVDDFVTANNDIKLFYLDLLAHRDISNAITDRYGIPHQSPQVLAIRNGKAVKHTSHYAIDKAWLAKNKA